MSKKKDKVITFVQSGLTDEQASDMISAIAKSKSEIAPDSRGTAAVTTKSKLGSILSSQILGIGLSDDSNDD